MQGGMRGRRRVAGLAIAMVVTVSMSACSSGDDDTGAEPVDTTAEPETTSDDAPPAEDSADADESAVDGDEPAPDADADADTEGDEDTEAAPAQLQALATDAQALCDALDEDEIRGIVGDFVELRPDDLFQDDRNLCQPFGDRFAVAGVWVYADRAERESHNAVVLQPFSPCEVGGYAALCQTHTGDPELFNGWPSVMVGVGSMAIEVDAPDPAVAQALAEAVLDDLGAP